jgi:SAM-dependent methyltransferase
MSLLKIKYKKVNDVSKINTPSYESILEAVIAHNNKQLLQHGNTPQGVGWNSDLSQIVRFDQVVKILSDETGPFSINDYGCGYGALLDYLASKYQYFEYRGYDVSPSILNNFRERAGSLKTNLEYQLYDTKDLIESDYTVASGVFGMKFGFDGSVWNSYIKDTLDRINAKSTKGFAFNMLTSYTDLPDLDSELYYADPCEIFDYCKRKFSRNVSLLHDYSLYDFTILVRKNRD